MNVRQLLQPLKNELRITDASHDIRLLPLLEEAVAWLQRFKAKTLVDTVADTATEVALDALDKRVIYLYVAVWFDNREDLREALNASVEIARDGQ